VLFLGLLLTNRTTGCRHDVFRPCCDSRRSRIVVGDLIPAQVVHSVYTNESTVRFQVLYYNVQYHDRSQEHGIRILSAWSVGLESVCCSMEEEAPRSQSMAGVDTFSFMAWARIVPSR